MQGFLSFSLSFVIDAFLTRQSKVNIWNVLRYKFYGLYSIYFVFTVLVDRTSLSYFLCNNNLKSFWDDTSLTVAKKIKSFKIQSIARIVSVHRLEEFEN